MAVCPENQLVWFGSVSRVLIEHGRGTDIWKGNREQNKLESAYFALELIIRFFSKSLPPEN